MPSTYKVGNEDALRAKTFSYLSKTYPEVLAFSMLDNPNISSKATRIHKKMEGRLSGLPDIYIEESRHGFKGMRIEQKAGPKESPFCWMPRKKCMKIENEAYEGSGVYTQEAQHMREQAYRLHQYYSRGFFVAFACGWEENRYLIDWYLTSNQMIEYEYYEFKWVTNKYGLFPEECKIPKISFPSP